MFGAGEKPCGRELEFPSSAYLGFGGKAGEYGHRITVSPRTWKQGSTAVPVLAAFASVFAVVFLVSKCFAWSSKQTISGVLERRLADGSVDEDGVGSSGVSRQSCSELLGGELQPGESAASGVPAPPASAVEESAFMSELRELPEKRSSSKTPGDPEEVPLNEKSLGVDQLGRMKSSLLNDPVDGTSAVAQQSYTIFEGIAVRSTLAFGDAAEAAVDEKSWGFDPLGTMKGSILRHLVDSTSAVAQLSSEYSETLSKTGTDSGLGGMAVQGSLARGESAEAPVDGKSWGVDPLGTMKGFMLQDPMDSTSAVTQRSSECFLTPGPDNILGGNAVQGSLAPGDSAEAPVDERSFGVDPLGRMNGVMLGYPMESTSAASQFRSEWSASLLKTNPDGVVWGMGTLGSLATVDTTVRSEVGHMQDLLYTQEIGYQSSSVLAVAGQTVASWSKDEAKSSSTETPDTYTLLDLDQHSFAQSHADQLTNLRLHAQTASLSEELQSPVQSSHFSSTSNPTSHRQPLSFKTNQVQRVVPPNERAYVRQQDRQAHLDEASAAGQVSQSTLPHLGTVTVASLTSVSSKAGESTVQMPVQNACDYKLHRYYRLPTVSRAPYLTPLDPTCVRRTPGRWSLAVVLGPLRDLFNQTHLSAEELQSVVDHTEALLSFVSRRMMKDILSNKGRATLCVISNRFLVADYLLSACELAGAAIQKDEWWNIIMEPLLKKPKYMTRRRKADSRCEANDCLLRRFSDAMDKYGRGERPAASELVQLKQEMFCKKPKKFGFHGSQWNPWRFDDKQFVESEDSGNADSPHSHFQALRLGMRHLQMTVRPTSGFIHLGPSTGQHLPLVPHQYEQHLYYRLPIVLGKPVAGNDDVKRPRKLRGPSLVSHLEPLRYILTKSSLTADEVEFLTDHAESLVAFALGRLSKHLKFRNPNEVIARLSARFLVLDALWSACEVVGAALRKEEWWGGIVGPLPGFKERWQIYCENRKWKETDNLLFAKRLVQALEPYEKGERASPQDVVELKYDLFFSSRLPVAYDADEWNDWRHDHDASMKALGQASEMDVPSGQTLTAAASASSAVTGIEQPSPVSPSSDD